MTRKTSLCALLVLAISGCGRGNYDAKFENSLRRMKEPPKPAAAPDAAADQGADAAPAASP